MVFQFCWQLSLPRCREQLLFKMMKAPSEEVAMFCVALWLHSWINDGKIIFCEFNPQICLFLHISVFPMPNGLIRLHLQSFNNKSFRWIAVALHNTCMYIISHYMVPVIEILPLSWRQQEAVCGYWWCDDMQSRGISSIDRYWPSYPGVFWCQCQRG